MREMIQAETVITIREELLFIAEDCIFIDDWNTMFQPELLYFYITLFGSAFRRALPVSQFILIV